MDKTIMSLGVIIIGINRVLARYCTISDFWLGTLLGVGIGIELLGIYLMVVSFFKAKGP